MSFDGTGTGTEGTDSTSTDAYDSGTILSHFHWWILRSSAIPKKAHTHWLTHWVNNIGLRDASASKKPCFKDLTLLWTITLLLHSSHIAPIIHPIVVFLQTGKKSRQRFLGSCHQSQYCWRVDFNRRRTQNFLSTKTLILSFIFCDRNNGHGKLVWQMTRWSW